MEQTRPDAPDLGPAVETPRVLDFVAALERDENYKGQVCHVEHFSAREPDTVAFSEVVSAGLVSAPVLAALQSEGITSLYQHQYFAIKAVKESNHVCLTTSTSSGKSLAFAIPILEDFQRSGNTRALILFPTKALAQDQLSKLHRFFSVCKGLKVCTFDGDTPKQDREALVKEAHVFLTNPDMLHYTMLATHARWRTVLETLRFVVLDEAHVYRLGW